MVQEKSLSFEEMKSLGAEEQKALFKKFGEVRALGKIGNYSCQYGAGVKTLARNAKINERDASKLHKGYWDLNWTIKQISESTYTKQTAFGTFQYNPISKMYYSLRDDKDRFSALVQGTGAYILDIWLWWCMKLARQRDLGFILLGQFHDELVIELDEDKQEEYHKLVADAMQKVNDQLKLNRELACDIKFGKRYSDIH